MNRSSKNLLAGALATLAMLPQAAADKVELGEDGVAVKGNTVETYMGDAAVGVVTTGNDGAEMNFLTLGIYENNLFRTYLDRDGITFPDGSEQNSAAYSRSQTDSLLSSLAPVDAWPMVCKTDLPEGVVPTDLSYATLICRSPQSTVPGGTIDSGEGVPSGHFFLVTDIIARCGIGDNCDGVFFRLTRRNIGSGDTDLETWAFPLSDTTAAGDKSVSRQFAGPLMILEEGEYLVGLGSLSTSGGHTMFAQVMGYLTASPERFGR